MDITHYRITIGRFLPSGRSKMNKTVLKHCPGSTTVWMCMISILSITNTLFTSQRLTEKVGFHFKLENIRESTIVMVQLDGNVRLEIKRGIKHKVIDRWFPSMKRRNH